MDVSQFAPQRVIPDPGQAARAAAGRGPTYDDSPYNQLAFEKTLGVG